jgi:hypothetical protein
VLAACPNERQAARHSLLIASVYTTRFDLIEVGQDTFIGQQVSLTAGMVPGQDLGSFTVLSIGDRCVISRGNHVVAHQSVTIGDDVWAGPYVYIAARMGIHASSNPRSIRAVGRQGGVDSRAGQRYGPMDHVQHSSFCATYG